MPLCPVVMTCREETCSNARTYLLCKFGVRFEWSSKGQFRSGVRKAKDAFMQVHVKKGNLENDFPMRHFEVKLIEQSSYK